MIKQLEKELQQIEDARHEAFLQGDKKLFDELGKEGAKIEHAIDQITERDLHNIESDSDSLFNN